MKEIEFYITIIQFCTSCFESNYIRYKYLLKLYTEKVN